MKSCPKVFVLLIICFMLVCCRAQAPKCSANKLKNDPSLLWALNGFLYTIYTSKPYSDNEIFKFERKDSENYIYTRTTNSEQCCKSMYVDAAEEDGKYFKYVIANDETCDVQQAESARMKLLAANKLSGEYCLILWTCRKSREGVHAFCSKKILSKAQTTWIQAQYKTYGLTPHPVKRDKDFSKGKCFAKPTK